MTIKQIRCILLRFFFVLICSMLYVSFASAAGRLLIKPNIEAGWQRDSNFHKSETNERVVDTYFVKPGFQFGYTTDKSMVALDYYLNVITYDDQDDVPAGAYNADEFDHIAHQAKLTAQTQATERLLFGLDNLFCTTRDPANADANSNAVDRYKYIMNSLTPRVSYRFGEKFGIDLKYTNAITDYMDDDTDEGEDSYENRGTFVLNYYFGPKTSFYMDYQIWARDYDKTSSDYTSNQVMANISRQFNYLTFIASAGYHNRTFDKTISSGDMEQIVWKVSLEGQNSSKSSVFLSFGSNLNDSGSDDTYYIATRFDARFSYLFLNKINCTLSGYFQNSDYETAAREDDRWYVDISADYLINDFFSVGLKAGSEERDSNEAGKDFDNNFIMVNLKFNYDMGSK